MTHARNLPEWAKEAKHAVRRTWEEVQNEVDMRVGARDCFAEREDLWRRVEGMDALLEANHTWERLYKDVHEQYKGVIGRLKGDLASQERRERLLLDNLNDARANGDTENVNYYEVHLHNAREEIRRYNYYLYGVGPSAPEDEDEALARAIAASDLQDV
jgi:hypothetical protein